MERSSDRALAKRLRGFDAVWRRVTAVPDAGDAAARQGVKLMPRPKSACRRSCQRGGR